MLQPSVKCGHAGAPENGKDQMSNGLYICRENQRFDQNTTQEHKGGLSVMGRISGPVPDKTQEKDTHPAPGLRIKSLPP